MVARVSMDEAHGKASKHLSGEDTLPAATPDELAPTVSGTGAPGGSIGARAQTPARAGTLADGDTLAPSKLVASITAIELAEEWRRLRTGVSIGIGVWIGFGVADWIVATWIHPGVLWPLLTIRVLVGSLVFVPGVVALYRWTPSRRRLRTLDYVMLQAAAWSIAVMTIWTGGISSLYYGGVSLAMVIRTALIAEPWRKGLAPNVLMMASFPAVSVAHALWSPEGSAQFSQPTELATFAINNAFLLCIAIFTILGGDALWRARRQVFESRSIGRYRLIRRIGLGGMGEVWSAWHRGLKREVALKLLTERVDDPVYVGRFEREVAATVSLSHPNTIRILDHGISDDGIRFYAMELLRGRDVGTAVNADGPLPVDRAAYLLRQVAHSLAEAHAKGIYHRDVKPENIFITNDGRYWDFVKVLDFGIARVVGGGAGAGLTKLG